jgi:hypothetical protein
MNTNQRKSAQLGMPFGTATNRLRKMILFKLLVDSKINQCFRCREDIGSAEDLSIEHKEPWFNRDVELFWDLNNIAFSHSWCNKPHSQKGGRSMHRKVGAENTAWCCKHQQFLPTEMFWKNNSRWNGLQSDCKNH